MDVAFSNQYFHPYLITIGYDQSLNVYSFLSDEKFVNKFSYKNEDGEVGYFTHVVFD